MLIVTKYFPRRFKIPPKWGQNPQSGNTTTKQNIKPNNFFGCHHNARIKIRDRP